MSVRTVQPPLCERCAYSTVARRAGGAVLLHCAMFKRAVPSDIRECSGYYPIGRMTPAPYAYAPDPVIIDVRPTPGQTL